MFHSSLAVVFVAGARFCQKTAKSFSSCASSQATSSMMPLMRMVFVAQWHSALRTTGGPPDAGEKWKFALCRYDYSVAHETPELSSSAPLTRPDFHRYEDYGELEFVGAKD